MRSACKHEPVFERPLHDLLIDTSTDNDHAQFLADWMLCGGKQRRGEEGKKWPELHNETFKHVDQTKVQAAREPLVTSAIFKTLTHRQQDMLVHLIAADKTMDEEQEVVFELLHSANRTGTQTNVMPCQLPHSTQWLCHAGRRLSGAESLLLQGADPFYLRALKPGCWQNEFLQNLGGNAFCNSQCIAWLVSVMAALTGSTTDT